MISISQMRLLRKVYRLISERDQMRERKGNLLSDEFISRLSEMYGLESKLRNWYGWKKGRQRTLDIRMEKLRLKGLVNFRETKYDYVQPTLMGEDCANHPVRDYFLYLVGVFLIPTISALIASFIPMLFK